MRLDEKALSSMQYMSSDTVKYALDKAMRDAGINIPLEMPPKNRSTFQKFLN